MLNNFKKNKMKQTAVEFLEQQYNYIGKLTPFDFYQSKAMEKEQIIDAHLNGQAEFDKGNYRSEIIKNSEQYYNETFGKK